MNYEINDSNKLDNIGRDFKNRGGTQEKINNLVEYYLKYNMGLQYRTPYKTI